MKRYADSKSRTTLLCPITPRAAYLSPITHHADNLAPITRHPFSNRCSGVLVELENMAQNFTCFCKETIAELVELLHREAKIQIDG